MWKGCPKKLQIDISTHRHDFPAPGKLTAAEFEIMKTHVTLGDEIIQYSTWLKHAHDAALFQHEKFDGGGYPHGICGMVSSVVLTLLVIPVIYAWAQGRKLNREEK